MPAAVAQDPKRQDDPKRKRAEGWGLFERHIPTTGESLHGAGYGIVSGAAQALGGTVEAAGVLLEQGANKVSDVLGLEHDTPLASRLQTFGRQISTSAEGLKPKKAEAASGAPAKVGQAVGSGLGFAAESLAGGGILRAARYAPRAAAWMAGGGAGVLGNFASGYSDALAETGNQEAAGWAYQQVIDQGGTPQDAAMAYGDVLRETGDRSAALQAGWLNGTISGPLEVAGLGGVVGKILGRADDASGGSVGRAIMKMVTEEGAQEGFAQLVENVGAHLLAYDEDRALLQDVAESTVLGGLAGGIVGGPLEFVAHAQAASGQGGPEVAKSGQDGTGLAMPGQYPSDARSMPEGAGRTVPRGTDAAAAVQAMLAGQGAPADLEVEAQPARDAEEAEVATYFEQRGGQAVFVDQPVATEQPRNDQPLTSPEPVRLHPAFYHRPTRTAVFTRGGKPGEVRKRFRVHEMGHHLAEVSRGRWQELAGALAELDPAGFAQQREDIRPAYDGQGLSAQAFEEEVVSTYLEDRGGLLLEGPKFEALVRKPPLLRTVLDALIRQLNRIPGIKIEERTTAALRRLRDELAGTDTERGIDPTLIPGISATVRAALDAIVGRAQPEPMAAPQSARTEVEAPATAAASTASPGPVTAPSSALAPSKTARAEGERRPTSSDPQAVRAARKETEAKRADLAAALYKAAGKADKAAQMAQEAARRRGPQRGETARRAQPTRAQAAVEAYEAGAEGGFAKSRRTLADVRAEWTAAGIENFASERDGTITLTQIVVPKEQRGRGAGTKAMEALTRYADETGQRIVLSPSTDFGATSRGRLVEFYKRFGFVENKGRARDFTTSESMFRPAGGAFALRRTPAFDRWFAGSKVVDEKGEPLVVYHGSIKKGLTRFDVRKAVEVEGGIFFSSNEDVAAQYTFERAYGDIISDEPLGDVVRAYLKIENPLEWRTKPGQKIVDAVEMGRAISAAKAGGHDGVIVRNIDDSIGVTGDMGDTFIVFAPEQIKSATDNRGTFDPENPDIRFALPPEQRQAALQRVRALAAQAEKEGEATEIGSAPAPERAKPTEDQKERALYRGVDAWRDETGRLKRIVNAEQEDAAAAKLASDRQATEASIRAALADGDAGRILEPWEMIAAAKLVQERMRDAFAAAPGRARDAAYSDAIELADAVRANRARTAQALQIFRDALRSPRERLVDAITEPQAEAARKLKEKRQEAKTAPTATERERAQKELVRIQTQEGARGRRIADALQKSGLHPEQLSDAQLADPEVQAEIARVASAAVAPVTSKLKEWRYAAMLSAPLTHKANVLGNGIWGAMSQLERTVEAAVNIAVRAPDAAQVAELVPYFTTLFRSLGAAGANFARSWRTERDAWEMHLEETGKAQPEGVRLDLWGGPAIPGKFGRSVRTPLRLLKAEDAFFKTLIGLPEAHAQAYRVARSEGKTGRELDLRTQEILDDPTHPVHARVQAEVLKRTFQKPGDPQGDVADRVLWLLLRARAAIPGGDFVLPFVTTPFRIFEEAFGLAFAPGILAGKAVAWPKTYGKNKAALAKDAARALIAGSLGLALLGMLTADDDDGLPLVTGTRPTSRGEADLAYRTVPPYHIKIAGEYRDYSRLEPLATILASLTDTARAAKDDPVRGMPTFFRSVYEQVGDKTFLQTIGDVQDALERPSGRAGVELVRDTLITPMFPNLVRQAARETDPFIRQEEVWPMDRTKTAAVEAGAQSLPYALVPARSIAPPIRFDLWGRPAQRFDPNSSPLGRYVVKLAHPAQGAHIPELHPIDALIMRFNERVDSGEILGMEDTAGKHFAKAAPDTTTSVDGKPVFFTPTEYARLQETAGRRASERLLALLAQGRLRSEDPDARDMKIIDRIINQARQEARSEILAARGLPVARLQPK